MRIQRLPRGARRSAPRSRCPRAALHLGRCLPYALRRASSAATLHCSRAVLVGEAPSFWTAWAPHLWTSRRPLAHRADLPERSYGRMASPPLAPTAPPTSRLCQPALSACKLPSIGTARFGFGRRAPPRGLPLLLALCSPLALPHRRQMSYLGMRPRRRYALGLGLAFSELRASARGATTTSKSSSVPVLRVGHLPCGRLPLTFSNTPPTETSLELVVWPGGRT